MQILLSSGIACQTHSLRQTEQFARELGYDGIELMLPPRHRRGGALETQGEITSLSTVRVVHAPNDFYDAARFRSSLTDALTAAQAVGAPVVTIHPASAYFGGRRNVEQGIALIKDLERSSGIVIGYEVLARAVGTDSGWHTHIAKQQPYRTLAEWLGDVRRYHLAATLDTCHVATWGEDPARYIETLGKRLVHVHFSDYDQRGAREHLIPGHGGIALSSFLRTLADRAPEMTVTVEVNPCTTPAESVRSAHESIQFIRDAVG